MALNTEEVENIETYLGAIDEDVDTRLNDYQRKFIESVRERYEQYGENLFMSHSQWVLLEEIYNKVTG